MLHVYHGIAWMVRPQEEPLTLPILPSKAETLPR